jgi:hypothetical protein
MRAADQRDRDPRAVRAVARPDPRLRGHRLARPRGVLRASAPTVAALFAKHVMPDPLVGLGGGDGARGARSGGVVTSPMIVRGTDLTRLMVTMGVAAGALRAGQQVSTGLTGGADGLQGVVDGGRCSGAFEFDLGWPCRQSFYSPGRAAGSCSSCSRVGSCTRRSAWSLQALRDNRLRARGDRPVASTARVWRRSTRWAVRHWPAPPARCWRRPPASRRSTCSTSTAAPT